MCFALSAYNNCSVYDFGSPGDVPEIFGLVWLIYSLPTFMRTWNSTLDFSIGVFGMLTLSILPFDCCGRLVYSTILKRIAEFSVSLLWSITERSITIRTCSRHVLLRDMSWTLRYTSARTFTSARATASRHVS